VLEVWEVISEIISNSQPRAKNLGESEDAESSFVVIVMSLP